MLCWKCKKEINVDAVYRNTECPLCHADLHSCKACKFYAPGNHFDCKETVEAPVADKEKANFCDFFMAGSNLFSNHSDDKVQAARSAAAALFGESADVENAGGSSADAAKKAFDSLFGD